MTETLITRSIGRRRAIRLMAAAAGGLGLAALAGKGFAAKTPPLVRWRGAALGAEASIVLHHPDPKAARRLIAAAVAEIRRLESVFSLYRPDSALSQLNRDGALAAPPLDLVQLMATAQSFAALTEGAFDPTVQPLWALYARHFRTDNADPAGPDPAAIEAARARVDYRAVDVASTRIAFARPDMAVTLNGIAQGYITDRVADLLRARGMAHVLLDLGEIRGLGDHPAGRPWRVGIEDPFDREHIARRLDLVDRAVATSAASGTVFEPSGRIHHLFDPRTGRSANRLAGVTVIAATATEADALSTALFVMPPKRIAALRERLSGVRAILTRRDGRIEDWTA